ncbi:MAG TPA: growth inhibitor PemK [Phenylobacterium sp.]
MALPEPVPGLVVRYSYLWLREQLAGAEEGRKDRPSAVVAAIRDRSGERRVLVLPITHSPPSADDGAIELPPAVKRRLGLDELRSWIVVSEYNEFLWPGPDLRRAHGGDDSSVAYGMLPPALFAAVRQALLAAIGERRARSVRRTE